MENSTVQLLKERIAYLRGKNNSQLKHEWMISILLPTGCVTMFLPVLNPKRIFQLDFDATGEIFGRIDGKGYDHRKLAKTTLGLLLSNELQTAVDSLDSKKEKLTTLHASLWSIIHLCKDHTVIVDEEMSVLLELTTENIKDLLTEPVVH